MEKGAAKPTDEVNSVARRTGLCEHTKTRLCRKMKHFFAERNASQRTPKGEQISPLENPLSLNVKSARAVLRAFKAPQKDSAQVTFAAQEESAPRVAPTNVICDNQNTRKLKFTP
jgi:hypothetical protein